MSTDEQLEQRVRASAPTVSALDEDEVFRLLARRRRHRRRYRAVAAATVVAAAVVAVAGVIATAGPTNPSAVSVRGASPGATDTTGTGNRSPIPVASATAAQLAAGRWSALPAAPIPPRSDASVVWTGHELVVWGGASGPHGATLHADGAAYSPATGTWRRLPPAPISAREGQVAVWTGTEMVIWGGYTHAGPPSKVTATGAAYNPATDAWSVLPTAPLSPRAGSLAAWTGSQVLILGGQPAVQTAADSSLADGALYNPATHAWTKLATPPAPDGHRLDWTVGAQVGDRYLAWSDWSTRRSLGHNTYSDRGGNDLFSYDETTNTWQLEPQAPHAIPNVADAVPAGTNVIVSGLSVNCGVCPMPLLPETTAIYHPATNTWTPAPKNPIAEANHLGFAWTGNAVVSFNTTAIAGSISPGDATAYNPTNARWVALPSAPFGCASSADPVWTGKQVLMYCPRPSHGSAAGHDGLGLTPAGTQAVGELTGTLTLSGLADNGKPLDGLITATGPHGRYQAVVRHGRFRIALPPGTYTVTGTSPNVNHGNGTCDTVGGTVNIHPGHTTSAHVECPEK